MTKTFEELRQGYPIAFAEWMDNFEKELMGRTADRVRKEERQKEKSEKEDN